VLSSLGQVVKVEGQVSEAGIQKIAVPVDGLSSGMYTISIEMQDVRTYAALLVK
jgi:hypothetical protein